MDPISLKHHIGRLLELHSFAATVFRRLSRRCLGCGGRCVPGSAACLVNGMIGEEYDRLNDNAVYDDDALMLMK